MTGKTKIQWTEQTWNPIVGCSIVSPGCTNCYAMKMAARIEKMNRTGGSNSNYVNHYDGTTKAVNGNTVWTGKLALAPDSTLLEPLRRKKPTTYFVNSMGDLFHEDCPDEWIDRVFAVMALSPQHTFQVLTKRAARMREYVTPQSLQRINGKIWSLLGTPGGSKIEHGGNWRAAWPLPNCWLGVSCERQQEAEMRIPLLRETPAAVRFVSAEPLLGPINLRNWLSEPRENGGGLVSFDNQKRPDSVEKGDDIVSAINLPDAHRLPASPLDSFVVPSDSAPHDGLQPLDKIGRSAVNRTTNTPALFGVTSPIDAALTVEQSGNITSQPKAGRHFDRASGRHSADPSKLDPASQEFAPDSLSAGAEPRADRLDRFASGVSIGDTQCPIGSSIKGHLSFSPERQHSTKLDWVIVGGESGPSARPMHPDWARSLRNQCEAAGVKFFFKQWGEWGCDDGPPSDGRDRIFEGTARCAWWDKASWHFEDNGYAVDLKTSKGCGDWVYRLGKKAAGRLLDGKLHDAMPERRA